MAVELIDGDDGTVVVEAVLATEDTKANEVVVVIEDLQALGGGGCQNTGHDSYPMDAAVADKVASDDKLFVLLGVVEPQH